MAKIKYIDTAAASMLLEGELASAVRLDINGKGTRAVYHNEQGDKIVMFGENLKEGSEGLFAAGTVEKIVLRTSEGQDLFIAEGQYKAQSFNAAYKEDGALGIHSALFGGNDKIIGYDGDEQLDGGTGNDRIKGRLGEDMIIGGKGDDVLTGGGGDDWFIFTVGDGVDHDRITDFDAIGIDRDHLELGAEIDRIGSRNGGQDTLITFDDGSTLELDGVTKAEFLDYLNSAPAGTD